MNDDKLILTVIFSILALVFLLAALVYRKDKIDIKNETRLYKNAVISLAWILSSFIIGAISTIIFLEPNILRIKIISGVVSLISYYVFIHTVLTARRPLLVLNKESLYSPSFGKIDWSSVKNISIGTHFSRNFFIRILQLSYLPLRSSGEQDWSLFFIVTLFDGRTYRINTRLYSVRSTKLFSLLKSYHEGKDIPEDLYASDNSNPIADSGLFLRDLSSYIKNLLGK